MDREIDFSKLEIFLFISDESYGYAGEMSLAVPFC